MEKVWLNDTIFLNLPLSKKERARIELILDAKLTRYFAELTDKEMVNHIAGHSNILGECLDGVSDLIEFYQNKSKEKQ